MGMLFYTRGMPKYLHLEGFMDWTQYMSIKSRDVDCNDFYDTVYLSLFN